MNADALRGTRLVMSSAERPTVDELVNYRPFVMTCYPCGVIGDFASYDEAVRAGEHHRRTMHPEAR
jgi:hypothetical protein